ncbi:MAG: hypothetical protein ACRC0Y_11215 [Fusobacteriaceae bacterium]
MKKAILALLLLISSLSYSSWWGHLDGGSRAAIVTGSALILGSGYNQSEYRHQQDLRRLDTQIRRGYERQAVIENANRKYSNMGASGYSYNNQRAVQQTYNNRRNSSARVIYSDQRSQILEMSDGTRIVINQ